MSLTSKTTKILVSPRIIPTQLSKLDEVVVNLAFITVLSTE